MHDQIISLERGLLLRLFVVYIMIFLDGPFMLLQAVVLKNTDSAIMSCIQCKHRIEMSAGVNARLKLGVSNSQWLKYCHMTFQWLYWNACCAHRDLCEPRVHVSNVVAKWIKFVHAKWPASCYPFLLSHEHTTQYNHEKLCSLLWSLLADILREVWYKVCARCHVW